MIGSGTILDTARFRALLGAPLSGSRPGRPRVRPRASTATPRSSPGRRRRRRRSARRLARQSGPAARPRGQDRDRSGGPPRGLPDHRGQGRHLARHRRRPDPHRPPIGDDENSALTVSMLTEEVEGVGPIALSLPRIVGRPALSAPCSPPLMPSEQAALRRSAAAIEERWPGAGDARPGDLEARLDRRRRLPARDRARLAPAQPGRLEMALLGGRDQRLLRAVSSAACAAGAGRSCRRSCISQAPR